MRSLITWAMIPLALFGSTVLAASVAVNLATAKGKLVPVRPAVLREKVEEAEAAPVAPAENAPAEAAPAPLTGETAHTAVLQLASDGRLPGLISVLNPSTGAIEPAEDLTVWFMQHGEIKATVKPGVAGVFQVQGLAPGVYSIIAFGKSGYLATAINLQPYEAPKAANAAEATKPVSFSAQAGLVMNALAVPPRDTLKVLQIANAYIPASSRETAPSQLIGEKDYLNAEELAVVEAANQGGTADPNAPYIVVLDAQKRLSGQLTRMEPTTGKLLRFQKERLKAFLVQGENVVAEAWVQDGGQFAFDGINAGDFTVVGAGPEGFTAFGVRVMNAAGHVTAATQRPLIVPVSLSKRAASEDAKGSNIDMANFPAAYSGLTNSVQSQQQSEASPPSNAPPGGGGGTGGGGAGGGGGGLGLLGAALGAAGLAAALANNDDEPSSP